MTELELELVRILSKKEKIYEGNVISIKNQTELLGQHLVYESLFSFIGKTILSINSKNKISDFFTALRNEIKEYYEGKNYKTRRIVDSNDNDCVILQSALPIIDQSEVDSIILIIDSYKNKENFLEIEQISSLLLFGIRVEVNQRGGQIISVLPSFKDVPQTWFDSKYIAIRELFLESGNADVQMSLETSHFRTGLVEANTKFQTFHENFLKKTDSITKQLSQQDDRLSSFKQDFDRFIAYADTQRLDFFKIEQETKDNINNYQNSVNEYLKTSILGNFWLSRARWATVALVFSIVIIIGLVGGATWAAFHFSGDIKGLITLKDLTDNEIGVLKDNVSGVVAFQLTRAFLLAVPVVLYFWIIKLAVRFFMRSLLLMDDARQRNTIMQSYVQMVRDGAVDEKVLPIIMWALCRSVPGHGPDGIEPPDFTEVIRAGSSLGKNPS